MDYTERGNNWRAHWRLIFDVINHVPRLQQEITVWRKEASWPPPTGLLRFAYSLKELVPSFNGGFNIEADHVFFHDGYIEYVTNIHSDIKDLVLSAGLEIVQPLISGDSEVVDGENVYIRADVGLHEDGVIDDFNRYPIFFFPQSKDTSDGVRLLEAYDASDDSRRIEWTVSQQSYVTHEIFRLERFQGRHGLRVIQDQVSGIDSFKFMVDSYMLDERLTIPNHKFPAGEQVFYIGRTPEFPAGLTGAVYHLEFDPNASCPQCPRPTVTAPGQLDKS